MRPTANRVALAIASAVLLSSACFYGRDSAIFAVFRVLLHLCGFRGNTAFESLCTWNRFWKTGKVYGTCGQRGRFCRNVFLLDLPRHAAVAAWLPGLVRRLLGFPNGRFGWFAVYFVGGLTIGIAMSKLVEYPILRLRDRILPASEIVAVARASSDRGTGESRSGVVQAVLIDHSRQCIIPSTGLLFLLCATRNVREKVGASGKLAGNGF